MSEDQVVERILRGETSLYGVLMLRYHGRLHSILYPILRDEAEVEDAIQEGHTRALAHLGQFEGRSSFVTWVTRIVVHEAIGILRRRRRAVPYDEIGDSRTGRRMMLPSRGRNPEQQAIDAENRVALARAVRMLPAQYRTVFVLREIDEMSTSDAAGKLGITEECVRIRLHRARQLLRSRLRNNHCSAGARRRRPTF